MTISRHHPPPDLLTQDQINATLRGDAPTPQCVYCSEPAVGFVYLKPGNASTRSKLMAAHGPEVASVGAFLCEHHVRWADECPRSFERDVVANLIEPYLPEVQS